MLILLGSPEFTDSRPSPPSPLPRGERGEKASIHTLSPCGRGWRAAPGEGSDRSRSVGSAHWIRCSLRRYTRSGLRPCPSPEGGYDLPGTALNNPHQPDWKVEELLAGSWRGATSVLISN